MANLSRGSVSIGMMGAIGVGVLVLVLIGLAVVFGSRRDGDTAVVTATKPVALAPAASAIPPIDAAAPAETEVATFALG